MLKHMYGFSPLIKSQVKVGKMFRTQDTAMCNVSLDIHNYQQVTITRDVATLHTTSTLFGSIGNLEWA